jgi:lipid II:glycine glycyltransferase (peptidoglycan interpeptide bridge formation enzyme)
MMSVVLKPDPEGTSARSFENDTLFQSPFWGAFKETVGRETAVFRLEAIDACRNLVVIFRPFCSGRAYGYIPYGPDVDVPEEGQGLFIEEVAEKLRPSLPVNCSFLRFDLPWKSPYYSVRPAWVPAAESAAESSTMDTGVPGQRLREVRMNFDSLHRNIRKAPTDLKPTHTVLIDLYRSEEELFNRMKPKTRYNIRLGLKKGLKIRTDDGRDLPEWYRIYRQTSERKGIVSESASYFERLFDLAGRRYPVIRLITARYGERTAAGIVLALYKNRAYYLYGASDYSLRHLMAPQLLQWEAVKSAKRYGCRWYDLFGIPPTPDAHHPMHGLYRFKTGFGGNIYRWRGCWDYPYDRDTYEAGTLGAAVMDSYHI